MVGKLNSLKVLNLSHYNITDRIPSLFGNLREDELLDLSYNKLLENISNQLTSLTFLSVLNLSYSPTCGIYISRKSV